MTSETREEETPFPHRLTKAPATHLLAATILTVSAWELYVLATDPRAWPALFYLPPTGTSTPQQLLLSPFAHESLRHFAANLAGLLVAGPFIERRLGTPRYTAIVLTLAIALGPLKVWIQGAGSLGASRFTVFLASVYLVHGPGIHRIQGWYRDGAEEVPPWAAGPVRWVATWFPWVLYAFAGGYMTLRYATGKGNVAHLASYLASVPLVAAWAARDDGPERGRDERGGHDPGPRT